MKRFPWALAAVACSAATVGCGEVVGTDPDAGATQQPADADSQRPPDSGGADAGGGGADAGGGGADGGSCEVASVAVTGLPNELSALETIELSADIEPAECADSVELAWSASSPGLVINERGEVYGDALGGPFTVTASAGGVEGSAQTEVRMADVVADSRWALAWADNPDAAEYEPATAYSSSTGGSIQITRAGPGSYAVRFAGLGRTDPRQRESVHVSPYGSTPARCRVPGWEHEGADLVASVQCQDMDGSAADSRFNILVVPAGSTQVRSAFVATPQASDAPLAAATAHSSAGAGVTLTHAELGSYSVRFEGLGRGSVQAAGKEIFDVTTHGEGTAWCKVVSWGASGEDASVNVRCFTPAGEPADAQFGVLMLDQGRAGDRRLGYVWADQPASADYTPSTTYNFASSGELNTASRSGTGDYSVSWTGLARETGAPAETNLVTAYGSTPDTCQVRSWATSGATTINCFSPAGDPVDSRFNAIWIE